MGLAMLNNTSLPKVTHFDHSVIQTDNQFLKRIIELIKTPSLTEIEQAELTSKLTKNNEILKDFKNRDLNRSDDDFQDIPQEDLELYTGYLNSNNHQKDFTAERILKPIPILNLTEPSPRHDEASSSTSHRRHSHHRHHSHGSKHNSPRGDKPKEDANFVDVPDDEQAHKATDAAEESAALDKFGTAATAASTSSTPPASLTTEPETVTTSKLKLLASSRIECGMKAAVGVIGAATVVIGAIAFKLMMDYMQQADVSKNPTLTI
jgi:hypothetical protein